MAAIKYDKNTFPLLGEGYARQGLTDKEIAKKLGISKSAFYSYQSLFPEFRDAIIRGKAPIDFEAENALLKRALGYQYEEAHTEIRKVGEKEYKLVRKVTKHVPPDVTALIFWLKNRMKDRWKDKQEFGFDEDITINVNLVEDDE